MYVNHATNTFKLPSSMLRLLSMEWSTATHRSLRLPLFLLSVMLRKVN